MMVLSLCTAALILGVGSQGTARESLIIDRDGAAELRTLDGLGLTIDLTQGGAAALRDGDRTYALPRAPLVRFEEVVADPDAEPFQVDMTPSAWGVSDATPDDGKTPPDTPEGADAAAWMRVDSGQDPRPTMQVRLDQEAPAPVTVSAECAFLPEGSALGWVGRWLAVNVTPTCADGERMTEQGAYFGQYQHGFQPSSTVVCPDRPLAALDLELTAAGDASAAWYRDIRVTPARYVRTAPVAPFERVDHQLHQQWTDPEAGLRGWTSLQPGRRAVTVRCWFESLTEEDRALSAWVSLPLDAVGGRWHDHARQSRVIEAGKVYRSGFWYGAGRDGRNSDYPFGAIELPDGTGLALGTVLDEPRVYQVEYDASARELRIRFDLGLSPDAGRWANRGAFTAVLFRYDARDGFRAAMAQYHALEAWAFTRRAAQGGAWLAFMTPRQIAGDWDEFPFQFIEQVGDMGWVHRQGGVSMRYAEPWIHHHEYPGLPEMPEVHGPLVPEASIGLAERVADGDPAVFALEFRRRHAGYAASYVEDAWGQPLGYFFRGASGGRNENMMMTNPDERLPAPGAPYPVAGWDRQMLEETLSIAHQWYLPGWTASRVSDRAFFDVDESVSVEGRRSVRLDPVDGKSYFEKNLRGVGQNVRYTGDAIAFSLELHARAERVGPDGVRATADLTVWYADGERDHHSLSLAEAGPTWQAFSTAFETKAPPLAVSVAVNYPNTAADGSVLWLDDVRLRDADGAELLENGGFEDAELLEADLEGVYLDTLECYEAFFNYRRSHWAFAEDPLTFDWRRRPAMHQVFSHTGYARRLASDLRPRDKVIFANCTPRYPFTAPWVDAMGDEGSWKHGETWSPKDDAYFNFVRFMCGAKPYGLLQYSDLTEEEQARYVQRCLFYGVFPSNQADQNGSWYWVNPYVVARHEQVFKRYMPVIRDVAQAGWEPLTWARGDDDAIWTERFGAGGAFYITCFNPGAEARETRIALDPRLGVDAAWEARDVLAGSPVPIASDGDARSVSVRLGPEEAGALHFQRPNR